MSTVAKLGPHIAIAAGLGAVGAFAAFTNNAGTLEGVQYMMGAIFDPFIAVPALILGFVVRNPLALAPVLFTLGFMMGSIYTGFYANMWPSPALQHMSGHIAAALVCGFFTNAIITALRGGYD